MYKKFCFFHLDYIARPLTNLLEHLEPMKNHSPKSINPSFVRFYLQRSLLGTYNEGPVKTFKTKGNLLPKKKKKKQSSKQIQED